MSYESLGRQMWAGIVLAIVGLTFASAGSGAEVQGSAERPALGNQVREYVFTDEEETADRVLADILADPRATVETVQPILKAGRVYGEAPVGAQTQMPVRVRQKTYRYGLYVPASYRPDKEYALVVCLHGAGFTGDAYLERWQTRLGEDYILACPTLIQGTWWTRTAEDLVLATIRVVTAKYRIDPDRIFLTGMSNGGIGTYLIGSHHATRFAGLAPMAAGLDDVLMPFVENLRHTPVYIIHGSKDEVMPVEMSRSMDKELTRLGYPHVYREHEKIHPMAGGHFFPREELPELVAWFGAQRRTAVPSSLTVVRDATHLTSFGWVRIDATDRIAAFSENLIDRRDETIVNRIYARLVAAVVAPNRIEVKTQRVRRYSLFLNEDMIDTSKPVTVLTDGRVSYDGPVTTAVEVLLREARHRQDPHQLFPIRLTINVDEPR